MIALRPKGEAERISKEVFRNKGISKPKKVSKGRKKENELYRYFNQLQH